MNGDWIAQVNQTMSGLLASHQSIFIHTGYFLFAGLGAIVLMLDGVHLMFSGGGFSDVIGSLIHRVFLFCVPLAILNNYLDPAPIFGNQSFCSTITGGPQYFAKEIGTVAFTQLSGQCLTYIKEHPFNLIGGVNNIFSTFVMWICMEAIRMAMFFVMSWGLIAQTAIILVGPLFIPFLVFQPLAFLFWNWFRSLLQYAFYPLIAAILVHVFATMLLNIWPSLGGVAMVPYFCLAIIGLFKAQALVSNLFAGSSGGGGGALALAGKFFSK
ncbi:MAG TPA: type IV secretion system protein [Terracidiphilus sp.]|jgi:hypothetical protein|nr:type IV secretion system protein [Terracidiphilus sp.]